MAVPYETIRAEVERLCNYVTHDLDRLIGQDVGGNYLAAALTTCACDAISYLKYGQRNRGDLFFTEILPDLWKPIAKTLYDAIRNGIVHTYETKLSSLVRSVWILAYRGERNRTFTSQQGEQRFM